MMQLPWDIVTQTVVLYSGFMHHLIIRVLCILTHIYRDTAIMQLGLRTYVRPGQLIALQVRN